MEEMTSENPSILTAFISPSMFDVTRRRSSIFSIHCRCAFLIDDASLKVAAIKTRCFISQGATKLMAGIR